MRINTQPISKQDLNNSPFLDINSIFYTIQGEGPYAGRPAVFIRLAGCNLQCPYCDTNYGFNGELSPQSITTYISKLLSEHDYKPSPLSNEKPLVVITGGEPFRQNISPLIKLLSNYDFQVQIETNGTLFVPDVVNIHNLTIVCSPKTGKLNKKLLPFIDAFKYIIHADEVDAKDGLPLKSLEHSNHGKVARPPFNPDKKPLIYVQPADEQDAGKNRRNLEAAINSAMTYGYTLCIQIHKTIEME